MNNLDLKKLLNIPLWENLQDQLAKETGTAIITVDFKGMPITRHSCRTEFCSVIRENPISCKRCHKCDALAGLEAVRQNKPFIYLCHCGIVDVAVPIMIGEKYLGAVMFGQVRIPNDDTDAKVEHLVSEISSFQENGRHSREDLLNKYEQLPRMNYRRIVEIAELINSILKYIIVLAVERHNEVLTYEWMLKNTSPTSVKQTSSYSTSSAYIHELSDFTELSKPDDSSAAGPFPVPPSSHVYPAVYYIYHHRREMVSMQAMANLCHLSPSYFSRLFSREVGENFTGFVNRIKVDWAKEMLRSTDTSISNVARSLGYRDTSYFIKVFKKYEGVTPQVYKQH